MSSLFEDLKEGLEEAPTATAYTDDPIATT